MAHLDTAFKLGAQQADADFQAQLNALAMHPDEEIHNSQSMGRSQGGAGDFSAPAGMVSRSNGPGETVGMGSLTGGKMNAPNVDIFGGGGPSHPSIEAPTAVAGIQQPGRSQPSAVGQSMGMEQRGGLLQSPQAPASSLASGPINYPSSPTQMAGGGGGAPTASLKRPSWAGGA